MISACETHQLDDWIFLREIANDVANRVSGTILYLVERGLPLPEDNDLQRRLLLLKSFSDDVSRLVDPSRQRAGVQVVPENVSSEEWRLILHLVEFRLAQERNDLIRKQRLSKHPDVVKVHQQSIERLEKIRAWELLQGIEPLPEIGWRTYLDEQAMEELEADHRELLTQLTLPSEAAPSGRLRSARRVPHRRARSPSAVVVPSRLNTLTALHNAMWEANIAVHKLTDPCGPEAIPRQTLESFREVLDGFQVARRDASVHVSRDAAQLLEKMAGALGSAFALRTNGRVEGWMRADTLAGEYGKAFRTIEDELRQLNLQERELPQPTLPTIKRLFALSGNRCAFPSCKERLYGGGGASLGEICHIKAQSAGGPRYDPALGEDEVHAFENLILLCANHHKLVDEDVAGFSASALQAMKVQHESAANAVHATDEIASALIANSGGIRQQAAAGGINVIGAGDVHIRVIEPARGNLQDPQQHVPVSAPVSRHPLHEQRVHEATAKIWSAVLAARDAVPAVFVYLDVATEGEFATIRRKLHADLAPFDSSEILFKVFPTPDEIAPHQPIVDEDLWVKVQAYRSFIVRVCALTFEDKMIGRPKVGNGGPWYQDKHSVELLQQVLGEQGVAEIMNLPAGRFTAACNKAQSQIAASIRRMHEGK